MAGLTSVTRQQLGAISQLRWRVFVNSLRSIRGRLNLVSRSIAGLLVLGAGLGGGFALGAGHLAGRVVGPIPIGADDAPFDPPAGPDHSGVLADRIMHGAAVTIGGQRDRTAEPPRDGL